MQRETEAWQIPPTTTGGVNIRSIISSVLEQLALLAFWQKHDPEFRFAPFLLRIPPDCYSRQIQGYFSTFVFERSFIIK